MHISEVACVQNSNAMLIETLKVVMCLLLEIIGEHLSFS
jgi:hypothetical protein